MQRRVRAAPIDRTRPKFDVIKPYLARGLAAVPSRSADQDRSVNPPQEVADYLRSWGVTNIHQVPRLLQCIEQWRTRLSNNDTYTKLGGYPIHGQRKTRLDFILFGGDLSFPGLERMTEEQRRKWFTDWTESNARIVRMIEPELRRIVSTLSRPNGRGNKKGAQSDFRDLYAALVVVERYMDQVGESAWPSFDGEFRS